MTSLVLLANSLVFHFCSSIGRAAGGGMASMMDEMQKTLARRRAKVERGSEEPEEGREKSSSPGKVSSQFVNFLKEWLNIIYVK